MLIAPLGPFQERYNVPVFVDQWGVVNTAGEGWDQYMEDIMDVIRYII